MPADKLEIDEAEEEGVIYKFLTNPLSFNGEDGRVKSITLQVMELGEPDASGRRRPVPVEGKTEEIAVDSVILAIGQKLVQGDVSELSLNERGNIAADADFFTTSIDGVFAIGDATNRGASIAIEAIGEADRCTTGIIDTVVETGVNVFAFSRYVPSGGDLDSSMTAQEYRKLLAACDKKFVTIQNDKKLYTCTK